MNGTCSAAYYLLTYINVDDEEGLLEFTAYSDSQAENYAQMFCADSGVVYVCLEKTVSRVAEAV